MAQVRFAAHVGKIKNFCQIKVQDAKRGLPNRAFFCIMPRSRFLERDFQSACLRVVGRLVNRTFAALPR